jgi:hypothetical protein
VVVDAGSYAVSISGDKAFRIFTVASNLNVVLKGLTLTSGAATEGAALRIEPGATVKLTGCTVSVISLPGPPVRQARMERTARAPEAMALLVASVSKLAGRPFTTMDH